jgi:hypothetical protein
MAEGETQLRNLVSGYRDHIGNDAQYLGSVFRLADVQKIAAVLVAMLRSGDRDQALDAEHFAVQSVIRGVAPEFSAYLPQSGLFGALRDLLYAPDRSVRHNAVYAIGKMSYSQYVPLLLEALPTYLERYPLELPGLIFELIWLSRRHRRRRWYLYERVAASPSFLVRWSLLETLGHENEQADVRDPAVHRLEQQYARLASDEHPLVSAEAAHTLALLRLHWEEPTLLPDERARRRLQLQKSSPTLSFFTFALVANNYLHAAGRSDYDLALLDQLARYQVRSPIKPPFDYAGYARAFERWRAQDAAWSATT